MTTAQAYLNHGRWVVNCPTGCGGAELADPNRPFRCGHCGHGAPPPLFPTDRIRIDATVETRPIINRNWYPDETVTDLQQENRDHGVDST